MNVDPGWLTMWTVYDHPRDFQRHVVVRPSFALPDGRQAVYRIVCLYDTIDEAHADCEAKGLHYIPRWAEDDEVIVGVWL